MAQQSLIGELPKIYEDGRREAARLLDRLGDPVKIGLQTNELVLPAKDKDGLFKGQVPSVAPPTTATCSVFSAKGSSRGRRRSSGAGR